MNGFADHGLDEGAFGDKKGGFVQAFDAFPKAKPQYVTRTSGGGKWTVGILLISALLVMSELSRWWRGHEEHTFAVEKGVGRNLQINLDIVVAMRCQDLHVNVQDASGDRILAGSMLKSNPTNWNQWINAAGVHRLGKDSTGQLVTGEGWQAHEEGFGEEHVHDIVSGANRRAKWAKTPRLRDEGNSCRIYGSSSVNKVQGDFHITARGHGYQEFSAAGHLEHRTFNFSHIISELSFGDFYPSLVNPLDLTVATTNENFHRSQYYISVVPTVYTVSSGSSPLLYSPSRTIFTNQYAVTEQSLVVGEQSVPGIFFKYDIEPLLLTVEESRDSFLRICVKIVNILSGVLVAGHWGFTISEWIVEVLGRRRRRDSEGGVLTGRSHERDD